MRRYRPAAPEFAAPDPGDQTSMARTVAVPASAQPNQLLYFGAGWIAFCILLGVVVGWQIYELRSTAVAIESAAVALEETGASVQQMETLPFVGKELEGTGAAILDAADDTRKLADTTRERVVAVAIAAGLGIALLPSVPMIALLLSLRRRRRRQLAAVRDSLQDPRRAPYAIQLLARQAEVYVPVDQLTRMEDDAGAPNDVALARTTLRLMGAGDDDVDQLLPSGAAPRS